MRDRSVDEHAGRALASMRLVGQLGLQECADFTAESFVFGAEPMLRHCDLDKAGGRAVRSVVMPPVHVAVREFFVARFAHVGDLDGEVEVLARKRVVPVHATDSSECVTTTTAGRDPSGSETHAHAQIGVVRERAARDVPGGPDRRDRSRRRRDRTSSLSPATRPMSFDS
jgi:hypothetical protein